MSDGSNNSCGRLALESTLLFVDKLLKCPVCKGSKVVTSIGGMEIQCTSCGKMSTYIKKYCKHPIKNYVVTPFLSYLVPLTVTSFFIMTCFAFHDPAPAKIAGAVSLFGSIFVALKFKLDQASYHKDLFDRRYAVFIVINDALTAWCSESKSTKEISDKINNDLMRKSYFLFSEKTYDFIREFRRALIVTETRRSETDDEQFGAEISRARRFLSSVVDGQKLADYFPELKINYY